MVNSPPARFDPFSGPPRLHGARRVGCRPGTEVIHPIAVSGERPLTWQVTGLPAGLTVDDEGIIRGIAPADPGSIAIGVRVSNERGEIDETVELCLGDQLALTPPMGWNSWNVYGTDVTATVVMAMADAMVETGMRDLGYSYINIDDHWHAEGRGDDRRPRANPVTFPDGIEAVAEHVHRLGLKLGLYSDAAPLTCGGCFGGLGHEEIDAQTYAAWGVDLLKYDYCHAPPQRAVAIERYGAMSRALASSGRSIVFSVCEWGMRRPWRWAEDLGASYWRTTPDIFDTFSWGPLGVRGLARVNIGLDAHAGPGHWNDPDMLLVGNRGQGQSTGVLRTPKKKRTIWHFRGISETQIQTHLSLWSMMAAPLLASHDLAHSTEFDLAMLLNPEILAINQDPLGVQGHKHGSRPGLWILAKPLTGGATAVSASNVSRVPRKVTVRFSDFGMAAAPQVTDAWTL
ncbi:MAG TPA: hypothetical protein VFN21_03315, partial [Acidimicrobiales bacterium]|nr:hypothetical protein [Acidimicrobiales bacterium]